jgi:hypothetical protein
MSVPTQQADNLYIRTREDLLQYEDALMNSLLQATANYYTPRNDQSIWGEILRAVAIELAQLEYNYAYDQVNKNPSYLTPPDIRRRWSEPLSISRIYPQDTQSDIAYRTMLVQLIQAYLEGSKVDGIERVISAYTGLNIKIVELYKLIGQFYDQSDRNSLNVSISVGGSLNSISDLNQLQAITQTLSGAINLAKPAHVGLNLATVFGSGEDIDAFILSIQDTLRIFVRQIEGDTFPPQLFLVPDLLPTTPHTGLAMVSGWPINSYYNRGQAYGFTGSPAIGDSILDLNGFVQQVTTAGTTYPYWVSSHVYNIGDKIRDLNNNIQTVTAVTGDQKSGTGVPTFSRILSGTVVDNHITWTNTSAFAFSSSVDGTTTDGTVVWTNRGVPPGVLAPRINQAWEISGGDIFNGFLMV